MVLRKDKGARQFSKVFEKKKSLQKVVDGFLRGREKAEEVWSLQSLNVCWDFFSLEGTPFSPPAAACRFYFQISFQRSCRLCFGLHFMDLMEDIKKDKLKLIFLPCITRLLMEQERKCAVKNFTFSDWPDVMAHAKLQFKENVWDSSA